jgi:pimeloyl-ACP methyl ester carboxylesterase
MTIADRQGGERKRTARIAMAATYSELTNKLVSALAAHVRQDAGPGQGDYVGTRQAQYDAVCAWGIPDHALLQRLSAIDVPVLVANGDSDPMILPHYSYLLAGLIPQARVKIYPDSAHGFPFQHHAEFAAASEAFLSHPS